MAISPGGTGPNGNGGSAAGLPGTTGRYLVLMRQDAVATGVQTISDIAQVNVTKASDFESHAVPPDVLAQNKALLFDNLAVVVVETPPPQVQALSAAAAAEDNPILAVEPERIVFAMNEPWRTVGMPVIYSDVPLAQSVSIVPDYLRGYRDAVDHLVRRVLTQGGITGQVGVADRVEEVGPLVIDETELTWGLQLTRVISSRFSGRGIRVAVLDTGFDFGHPDFLGRNITSRSFINGETADDGHGHGTHCIGTACGPQRPSRLPRYGVAFNSDIFVGKVLNNSGRGADGGILAGIEWAIANQCAAISMSLGASVTPGQGFSPLFEAVARRALAAGTLIIAAAGNDSRRPSNRQPVSHPANCPSILAVGAVDQQLNVAPFSNAGLNPEGGQVDIVGPGVSVYSSVPRPTLYRLFNGTSMATPHVAGIAALYAETNPSDRGTALWSLLVRGARRLPLLSQDVGAGLVQAP